MDLSREALNLVKFSELSPQECEIPLSPLNIPKWLKITCAMHMRCSKLGNSVFLSQIGCGNMYYITRFGDMAE